MESIKVEGKKRTSTGSTDAKAIRKEGLVPCVIYGQEGVSHFSVTPKSVKGLIYTPDFKLADLSIDGKAVRAIIKDIQFHPVTDAILHLDFLQLKEGVPVKVNIPLRSKGIAVGVKGGGKLIQQVRSILVKVKPEHMVNELFVDVTSLELGQAARVKDVEVTEHMEVMNPLATPVIAVEIPRALRSATDAAEGEEEPLVEGAVISTAD